MEAKCEAIYKERIVDVEFKISRLGILGKAYYELAQIKLKRHRAQISIARTQNLLLHAALGTLREQDRVARKNTEDLEHLQKTASLRVAYDHQRSLVFKRQSKLEWQITGTHSAELECAGVLDPNTPPDIRIRLLEHKLAFMLQKLKDVQILVKQYESTLQPLRDDWVIYDSKLATLQSHVNIKSQECELLINTHHDAIRARDAAKIELEELLAFLFGYGKKGLISPELRTKILKAIKEIKLVMNVGSMREMYYQFILQEKQSTYLESIFEEMSKMIDLLKDDYSTTRRRKSSMMDKHEVSRMVEGTSMMVRRHSTMHPATTNGAFPLIKILEGTQKLVNKLDEGHITLIDQTSVERRVLDKCKERLVLILQALHRQLKRLNKEAAKKAEFEAKEAAHWAREEAEVARRHKAAEDARKKYEEREAAREAQRVIDERVARQQQQDAENEAHRQQQDAESEALRQQQDAESEALRQQQDAESETQSQIYVSQVSAVPPEDIERESQSPEPDDHSTLQVGTTPQQVGQRMASAGNEYILRSFQQQAKEAEDERTAPTVIFLPNPQQQGPAVVVTEAARGLTETEPPEVRTIPPNDEAERVSHVLSSDEEEAGPAESGPHIIVAVSSDSGSTSPLAAEVTSNLSLMPIASPLEADPLPTIDSSSIEEDVEHRPGPETSTEVGRTQESVSGPIETKVAMTDTESVVARPVGAAPTIDVVSHLGPGGDPRQAAEEGLRKVVESAAVGMPTEGPSAESAQREPAHELGGSPAEEALSREGSPPLTPTTGAAELLSRERSPPATPTTGSAELLSSEVSAPATPTTGSAELLSSEVSAPATPTTGTTFESAPSTPRPPEGEYPTGPVAIEQSSTTEIVTEPSAALVNAPSELEEGGSPTVAAALSSEERHREADATSLESALPRPEGESRVVEPLSTETDESPVTKPAEETLSSETARPADAEPPSVAAIPSDVSATASSQEAVGIPSTKVATMQGDESRPHTPVPTDVSILTVPPIDMKSVASPGDSPPPTVAPAVVGVSSDDHPSKRLVEAGPMIPIEVPAAGAKSPIVESKEDAESSSQRSATVEAIPSSPSHDSVVLQRPISSEPRLPRSPSGAPIASGAQLPPIETVSIDEGSPQTSIRLRSPNLPRSPSGAPVATAVKFPLSPLRDETHDRMAHMLAEARLSTASSSSPSSLATGAGGVSAGAVSSTSEVIERRDQKPTGTELPKTESTGAPLAEEEKLPQVVATSSPEQKDVSGESMGPEK